MYKSSSIAGEYANKLITAEQAAGMVKSGDRLHFGLGCGSTEDIDEALAKRADELTDIEVLSTVTIRKKPFALYEAAKGNDNVRFISAHFRNISVWETENIFPPRKSENRRYFAFFFTLQRN